MSSCCMITDKGKQVKKYNPILCHITVNHQICVTVRKNYSSERYVLSVQNFKPVSYKIEDSNYIKFLYHWKTLLN